MAQSQKYARVNQDLFNEIQTASWHYWINYNHGRKKIEGGDIGEDWQSMEDEFEWVFRMCELVRLPLEFAAEMRPPPL
tara:strand:- start:623 stop:856 length:234 start_codon:yes stop_codon:yes gene_type:complete